MTQSPRIAPPPSEIATLARDRVAALATPPGALGRLGELGAWLCAAQGVVPPRPLTDVRLVVLAGDHGVAAHGVSAYPAAVTEAMVRTLVAGSAGVSALARAHGVAVSVVDVAVDADLDDLPDAVTARKVRRGSEPIHLADALTRDEAERSLALGAELAAEQIDDGAQLLMTGDLGIGNTTAAAALVATVLGLPADEVTGRGTGIDDDGWRRKRDVIEQALARAQGRTSDPVEVLAALGSADLAATVGFLVEASTRGVPVLLDGLMSLACAVVAEAHAPGAAAWWLAGHRSTEPAQAHALKSLGLEPVLDLGMRLGEGSGAVAAVPVLRSAIAVLREVALLSEIMPS
ncbi:nicotinate-nucleotide--dimethylbenzimidazole phosphoribosyltransferase [Nocardioides sp. zg-1228]|uniref:nicotinate-nucleotide--dimethylbenzimidazole phosphoribosyltransferase n=1 Tax=Nocardioides sp. zg-1228 TaxID=2763008 RepID=UPI001643393B|nr:nicotinate-nucleotide--dimethylbenzimidazole phosphoribosyltransferase [Nocardioides sp. zg-1228]MBC2934234.1 nicotinate-nucleotide--dimethylbenzimidazole phosphoribosyltransferase [Nocardioides sp. zg-1228]QSF59015.1 nicotinate-nucleotide--dimethylbenzimidazole phosphoribosyltransferase [Nocardioides sp. zg-1228]